MIDQRLIDLRLWADCKPPALGGSSSRDRGVSLSQVHFPALSWATLEDGSQVSFVLEREIAASPS